MKKEPPLFSTTPDAWADAVLAEPLALLSDHAHLEKKACANALELLNRWPHPGRPRGWESALAGVARDEALHLERVLGLLEKRGGRLERGHSNPYATELHKHVRRGQGPRELLDRLLVSALIEARSCERFGVLARRARDAELARLYRGLWSSEFGHHQVFLKLAGSAVRKAELAERWDQLRRNEADLIAAQPPGPRMHGGAGGAEDGT